ncbi:MAG: acyl-CoA synthetase, partial [Acidimicrobiia bacterium]
TETGMNGIKIATKGEIPKGGPATVQPSLDSIVVDEDYVPIVPGSGAIGRIARTGNIPLGYYNDPERSALVFFEHGGERYSIPGDFATVESDGQVTLLGRGSIMINTGGEKVFPEEVEGVLKAHPAVFDCLVVGVTDERWGERVTAVVQARPGTAPTVDELAAHCRQHIAAYKAPKQVFLVDQIQRAPSGKPDYPWAKEFAQAAAAS